MVMRGWMVFDKDPLWAVWKMFAGVTLGALVVPTTVQVINVITQ